MRTTSLLAARSMSIELTPADFRRSFNWRRKPTRLPDLVVTQPEAVRMCLLPQSRLLLLLSLLHARLFPGQHLARLAHGAAHALVRFRFGCRSRHALFCGDVMLGNAHQDVAGAPLITERPAHRRRTQPLPARTFVDKCLRNVQRIHV